MLSNVDRGNMKKTFVIITYLTLVAAAGALPAYGQPPGRDDSVLTRARPEYDPLGIRVGGFLLSPTLTLREEYNDNIFASERGKVDDFITIIGPALELRSDWNNHALKFRADGEIGRHADDTQANYEDFSVGADGRLDVTRNIYFSAQGGYARRHERRGSANDTDSREPTVYDVTDVALAYFHRFNRLSLKFDGKLERLDFDDVSLRGGEINNDDRDRKEIEAGARVGYEYLDDYEGFLRGTFNRRLYDESSDDEGLDRDSSGFEAVAGTEISVSGVTSGEVFAGYRRQNYSDASLERVEGPTFGAAITWNVTGLTTVRGFVDRAVGESTTEDASGFFSTEVGLKVDHELLRNLLLNLRASGRRDNYKGIGRDDDIIEAGLGAKYLLNRYLYLTLDYDYRERDSDDEVSERDFAENKVMFGVELNL